MPDDSFHDKVIELGGEPLNADPVTIKKYWDIISY